MDDSVCVVHGVRLPVNRPFTGRYAVYQPLGEGRFPNFEDHIVIARSLGGDFRPTVSVFVPFDEPPLLLWDDIRSPDVLVLHHRFYLAYSLDGAHTFHRPTEEQLKALGVEDGRWTRNGIIHAHIHENHLVVSTRPSDWDLAGAGSPPTIKVDSWELPLEPRAAPLYLGRQTRPLPQDSAANGDAGADALLMTDGTRLFARSHPEAPFTPVPLTALTQRLSQEGDVDFFGGSGARSFF
jgi:hypothetical protein